MLSLAKQLAPTAPKTGWDDVKEYCDLVTGYSLQAVEVELLADMVEGEIMAADNSYLDNACILDDLYGLPGAILEGDIIREVIS